jgi:hydroxyacylglutathione hydrolase
MILRRFYNESLAQASYLLGCSATGDALIVDPNRHIQTYVDAARAEGLKITHVTETHIHADFLSGLRELCHATGAKAYLSGEGGTDWQYAFASHDDAVLLHDGDRFMVGNIRIDVVHTPGHTPEHLTFLVTDTAGADRPMGALTGDFIFAGDVGRPDLLEKAAGIEGTMETAARSLFASLQRFKKYEDYLQLWPGHGAGSACGKALGAVPQTTLGYEKLFNPALTEANESAFTAEILSGQPAPPPYFAVMKRLNREGPALVREATVEERNDAGSASESQYVIDVRPWRDYAREHISGTLSLPLNKSFLKWAGWLLPYDRDIAIVAADATAARSAAHELKLIGIDRISGFYTVSAIEQARAAGRTKSSDETEVQGLRDALQDDTVVIDVRNDDEWAAGHVPTNTAAAVLHIPLGDLDARIDEIPDGRVLIHCQAGSRSAIAVSILEMHGIDATNVRGGFEAWTKNAMSVERGEHAGRAN